MVVNDEVHGGPPSSSQALATTGATGAFVGDAGLNGCACAGSAGGQVARRQRGPGRWLVVVDTRLVQGRVPQGSLT